MRLPPGWLELSFEEEGMEIRAIRVFSPADNHSVRMQMLNRGYPLGEEDTQVLRKTLSQSPKAIFERKDGTRPGRTEVELVSSLAEVLGNLADNQLLNSESDDLGPSFMLDRIDVLDWKGRKVLAVRGWFRDPEQDIRVNNYCGLFIDSTPGEPESQIEEIYLEAPTEDLLVKYMPLFKASLDSLVWR